MTRLRVQGRRLHCGSLRAFPTGRAVPTPGSTSKTAFTAAGVGATQVLEFMDLAPSLEVILMSHKLTYLITRNTRSMCETLLPLLVLSYESLLLLGSNLRQYICHLVWSYLVSIMSYFCLLLMIVAWFLDARICACEIH